MKNLKLVSVESVNRNHWMPDFQGSHYIVRIKNDDNGVSIAYPFSMGMGHGGNKPDLELLLENLTSEYFDESYDDFCDEFGYDYDDKNSKRIFKNIKVMTNKIIKLFGSKENAEDFIFNQLN